MKRILFLHAFFLLVSFSCFAQEENPKDLLKAQVRVLKIHDQNYLGIFYQNAPDWHTYWKNPGEAGTPFTHYFTLNAKETKFNPMEWPAPKRYLESGDIIGFGYEGVYGFFFELPPQIEGSLEVKSNWLICKHRCIPGNSELKGQIKNNFYYGERSPEFLLSDEEAQKIFDSIPKSIATPSNMQWSISKTAENQLMFFYQFKNPFPLAKVNLKKNLLTPFPFDFMSFKREELFYNQDAVYGKFAIDWEGDYREAGPMRLPDDGVLNPPLQLQFLYANPETGLDEVLSISVGNFALAPPAELQNLLNSLSSSPLTPEVQGQKITDDNSEAANLKDDSLSTATDSSTVKSKINEDLTKKGIWYYLLLAFIGGLILNFMPCVLPIISIKLFSLLGQKGSSRIQVAKHNLGYTLGILSTMMLLGGLIIALKASGEQIGWGFQLQSPFFMAFLIIILFVFAFNMFGLFELNTPGGKFLGAISFKDGFTGDFFNGILAVVLSTPCSAPFLGTALSFAFLSSSPFILAIFFMIGLGLSFPFLMTALFPITLKILPKPGAWMEHLKKFLGLSLLLTAVWLIDVFVAQIGASIILIELLGGLVFLFFAFYFSFFMSKKKWIKVLIFIIPLSIFGQMFYDIYSSQNHLPLQETPSIDNNSELNWHKWSQESMNTLRETQNIVFIDFTADWCLTCKVNEKTVLQTKGFISLVSQYDIQLLKGDWTKKDPEISQFLSDNGIVGVPAYFIQKPDGTLVKLGELISLNEIRDTILKIREEFPLNLGPTIEDQKEERSENGNI